MPTGLRRKTADELLLEVQAEEAAETCGRLKIFLGYASGVGKSFRMLDEARRRRERGQDVVVGAIQPEVPHDVEATLDKLEVIPLQTLDGGSVMDTGAILRRHPGICIIDGLAYNNPPGSRNPTRWQDVRELLDAGISVIASINIQYVEELSERVEAISGKHVTQTVPVKFIQSADEIVLVDAPAEEPVDDSREAEAGATTRSQKLSRLRELALVLAADVVDHQLMDYLRRHGIQQQFGANERVLVCITPRTNIAEMLETARAIADRFHGELIVAYVNQPEISPQDRAALDERLALARAANARIEILDGEDIVTTILDFAKSRGVTQLFIGHTQRSSFWSRVVGSPVDRLIRLSESMDVRVFPQ
ncbi:MAG TPA: universal stress protein [Bryobacteraceae bacterium]|nr:universal stress protein [Bryobacteraceae bacterium]